MVDDIIVEVDFGGYIDNCFLVCLLFFILVLREEI